MKILLVAAEPRTLRLWSEVLELEPAFEVESLAGDAQAAAAALQVQAVDLAMIDTSATLGLESVESWAGAWPQTDFVIASADTGPQLLMRAMRSGVREVLPTPASPEAVLAALRRQMRKRLPIAPSAAAGRGEVVSVVSCKGGSGATFVAANVAHLLARAGQRRVALLDLNLQFGDAALFLSSTAPTRHLSDLARDIGRLDADLLRACMSEVSPGLWVLAAPEDPALAAEVTPEHVRRIVQVARSAHDHVVIDVGRALSPVTLQALDLADRVLAVLQLTLPFIRDGQRLRRVFRSLDYPEDKVRWIVNRHQRNGAYSLDDLKRTLGVGRVLTLPNHYEAVADAVNQGLPLTQIAPRSTIARSLRELAEEMLPAEALPPSAVRRLGLWLRGAAAPA